MGTFKDNISGVEAFEILRNNPDKFECKYLDDGHYYDWDFWQTSLFTVDAIHKNDFTVRIKKTKLDKIMEEVKIESTPTPYSDMIMIDLNKLRSIIEKVQSE